MSTHLSYLKENSLATDIWHYVSFEVVSKMFGEEKKPPELPLVTPSPHRSKPQERRADRAVTKMISGDLLD